MIVAGGRIQRLICSTNWDLAGQSSLLLTASSVTACAVPPSPRGEGFEAAVSWLLFVEKLSWQQLMGENIRWSVFDKLGFGGGDCIIYAAW